MIQGIILRLSGFSANAKNFCITILAAVIGISFQHHLALLIAAAAFVIITFAALDTYYLAQERRFRAFYADVAARPLSDAHQLELAPPKLDFSQYLAGALSFSTGGFYLLLLIVASALLCIAYGRSDETRLGVSGAFGASERHPDTTNVGSREGIATSPVPGKPDADATELVVPGGSAPGAGSVRSAPEDTGGLVRSGADPAASKPSKPVR
jgi:hypothetical protein